ncbi:glycosyltransferase family 2 protein [Aeromonas caviae]|uniref:Glycosyltransferase n=1 Tax=Aeromonas caviae TaxID=648 RepID=A0AA43AJG9_AERCA|nr:glycosyltransferase family 2 protein [Aeromonas caviae]MCX4033082.1 glycosyltransferase family 2 protein [Aeromonas caviae]MDH1898757.1 glycosyltransferase [Aeromonas caviae]
MNKLPLVSIVMPSHNSDKTISAAISSIVAQDYQHWELLITDDKSSDNTIAILKGFEARDPRINVLFNDENLGAGFSRNQSIRRARGKYIAFLDSDDLWKPDKLKIQVSFMEKNNYVFTFTSYQMFSNEGDGKVVNAPSSITYDKLLYGNVIGCLTVMYNAEVLGRQEMPLIRKRQDMGLWLALLTKCDKAYGLPDVLAKYRTDSGMTQNKLHVAKYQWEFYRTVVQLNLLRSSWYFFWYALNGFLKHRK